MHQNQTSRTYRLTVVTGSRLRLAHPQQQLKPQPHRTMAGMSKPTGISRTCPWTVQSQASSLVPLTKTLQTQTVFVQQGKSMFHKGTGTAMSGRWPLCGKQMMPSQAGSSMLKRCAEQSSQGHLALVPLYLCVTTCVRQCCSNVASGNACRTSYSSNACTHQWPADLIFHDQPLAALLLTSLVSEVDLSTAAPASMPAASFMQSLIPLCAHANVLTTRSVFHKAMYV